MPHKQPHGLSFSLSFSDSLTEGDRKVNIDILEANKGANREDIRRLRDDNKELRQKLAQLQRVREIKIE